MLPVRVIVLPLLLTAEDLMDRTAVVFDVLRATTTMATALDAGAEAVQVYGSLDDARAASAAFSGPQILAGETNAKKPSDFMAGNSPCEYTPDACRGKTLIMATTNGTKALVASKAAAVLAIGAIVNARATAAAVVRAGSPVTLVCSGTEGRVSGEDLIGCGAVIDAHPELAPENDAAHLAVTAWRAERDRLNDYFLDLRSGHNLRKAGLLRDIPDVTVADRLSLAVRVRSENDTLVARRWAD